MNVDPGYAYSLNRGMDPHSTTVFRFHFQIGHCYASSTNETFGPLICALCSVFGAGLCSGWPTRNQNLAEINKFDKPVVRNVFSDKRGKCNIQSQKLTKIIYISQTIKNS